MKQDPFFANVFVISAWLFLSACTPSVQGSTPTTSAVAPGVIPDFIPTITPVPATATSIPNLTPTTLVASPASTWKEGWVDFTNSYYGYTISVPASAQVIKNVGIGSYSLSDVPADWDPEEDFMDYLNITYPPGLCVTIENNSAAIYITAADSLGGKLAMECQTFGGLGEGNWVTTEEEVTVDESIYTATVVRRCDANNQNCGDGTYGIESGDGTHFVLGGVGSSNQDVLLEILRSFRPAEKTELYCPKPAPTRLEQDTYAFVSTDPPLAYNNVRSAPGINQELVEKIAPGEALELLEGPVCNNSLQWWKVSVVRTGLVGWTPEGDHKSYWLNPCETKDSCGVP